MRVDSWIETGTEVSGYYDPMLAKIIARGATRDAAIAKLAQALAAHAHHGIETNLAYLRIGARAPGLRRAASRPPRCSSSMRWRCRRIEVLDARHA